MVSLSLGTAPLEIATALALAAAIGLRRWPPSDLLQPVLAVAALSLVASLGHDLRGGASVGWALALVVAVPLLPGDRTHAARWGTGAAAVLGAGALLWAAAAAGWPARGLYSHHLTLGYVLLPALAVAVSRRWWWAAAGCAAGVLSTVSLGPALGMLVALAGTRAPRAALAGGTVLAVAIIALMQAEPALGERAVLWASGAEVMLDNPLGVGSGSDRPALAWAQDRLSPGFYFPLHAHDAVLQVGVEVGPAGWLAWGWLLVALWKRADQAGRAGLAAVLVGGLTQDTLGDLEVCRAVCAWALLGEPSTLTGVQTEDDTSRVAPEA